MAEVCNAHAWKLTTGSCTTWNARAAAFQPKAAPDTHADIYDHCFEGRLELRQVPEIFEQLSEEGLARSRHAAAVEWIASDEEARRLDKNTASRERRLARPYAHPYFWAGFIYTGL